MVTIEEHLARKCIVLNCDGEITHTSATDSSFACIDHHDLLIPPWDFIGRLECYECHQLFLVGTHIIYSAIYIDDATVNICQECWKDINI